MTALKRKGVKQSNVTRFCLNPIKVTFIFLVAQLVEFREQLGFSCWASKDYVHHRRDVATSNFAVDGIFRIVHGQSCVGFPIVPVLFSLQR